MRPRFTNLRKCLVCHPAELVFKAFQPQNKQELCCVMPNKQCARSVPGRNLGKFAIVSKQSFSVTWKLSLIQKLSNQFSKLLSGFSCYSCELFHRTQQDYLQTTPLPWYRKALHYPSPSAGNFPVLAIFAGSSEYLPEWDKQHLLITPYTQTSAYVGSCSVGWSTKAKLRGFVKKNNQMR